MKILIVADVHNRPNGSAKTLERIEKAIKNTPCDLIVFLGDIVHGPATPVNYEYYLRQVLDLTGDIPFATVFGNHDDECGTSKEEILAVMQSYKNCLTKGRDYALDRMGETLIFLDSGAYYDGEGSFYDTVKPEQIEFAKSCVKDKSKKAILFQHIIVPDIMELLSRSRIWTFGAVYGEGSFYKFKKGVRFKGRLGEPPCPPDINTGELKELAPYVKAMCFGHDHKNTFELDLMGVRLIQCAGSGSNSYDKYCRSSLKLLDTETLETQLIYLS